MWLHCTTYFSCLGLQIKKWGFCFLLTDPIPVGKWKHPLPKNTKQIHFLTSSLKRKAPKAPALFLLLLSLFHMRFEQQGLFMVFKHLISPRPSFPGILEQLWLLYRMDPVPRETGNNHKTRASDLVPMLAFFIASHICP